MHRARIGGALVAGVVAATLSTPLATVNAATDSHDHGRPPTVVARDLTTPLKIAVDRWGGVYASQAFIGTITRTDRRGRVRTLVDAPGSEVEGVDVSRWGVLAYLRDDPDGQEGYSSATLRQRFWNGRTRVSQDFVAYERKHNPDADQRYGLQGRITPECRAALPAELLPTGGPVDSHPYGLARLRDGSYLVADAAGNDLLRVNRRGRISLVAVLPPQPLKITAEFAKANGLPDALLPCVVGKVFNFEPVPTDVEVGPHGALYVSLLPGGPEDPSAGARGAVYKVLPSGRSRLLYRGLAGATDLAVSPRGVVYATELFGGRVSRLINGVRTTVARLASPAAVEYLRGSLYVSTNTLPEGDGPPAATGQVVRIRL